MLPKYIRNTGKAWSPKENLHMRELADKNTPTRVMGLLLGRTEASIYTHASQLGVSLHPTNQKPYGTKK